MEDGQEEATPRSTPPTAVLPAHHRFASLIFSPAASHSEINLPFLLSERYLPVKIVEGIKAPVMNPERSPVSEEAAAAAEVESERQYIQKHHHASSSHALYEVQS